LAALVAEPGNETAILLARVSIDPARLPDNLTDYHCFPGEFCPAGVVVGTQPQIVAWAGWRHSGSKGELVDRGDGSGSHFVKRIVVPSGEGLFALRDGEFLGPIASTADGLVWSVAQLESGAPDVAPDSLFIVSGWLVQTPSTTCPPHPESSAAGANPDYWCGGSFITAERAYAQSGPRFDLDPGGLQVQWMAYQDQFTEPSYDPTSGYEPQYGRYLIRSAGCPPVNEGCPVWRLVGSLDVPTEAALRRPEGSIEIRLASAYELLAATSDRASAGRVFVAPVLSMTPVPGNDPRCFAPGCATAVAEHEGGRVPIFSRSTGATTDPSHGAYRVLDGALELIGAVSLSDAGGAWSVGALREHTPESDLLYPVLGWLTETPGNVRCPDTAEADSGYRCAASWLTDERVVLPRADDEFETVPAEAMQVQHWAYVLFGHNADIDDDGAEPWRDVYLVRTAGCPVGVLGDCPVWEMSGTVDNPGARDATVDCRGMSTHVDGPLLTPQQRATFSDAIPAVRVEQLGPGFWDSGSGSRPTSLGLHPAAIVTSVTLRPTSSLKGSMDAGLITINGGRYGCDSHFYNPAPRPREGERYVVFLSERRLQNPDAPPAQVMTEAWRIGQDGRVMIPDTQEWVAVDDLGAYLQIDH
jgi:hypothetical protein